MLIFKREANVGNGLGARREVRGGAAAGLVCRCQIWTNGADLRGAERVDRMPKYSTAQSRRNVREPAGLPPWAGAGFKNFGIYLGQKTLVHPLCLHTPQCRRFKSPETLLPMLLPYLLAVVKTVQRSGPN